MLSIVQNFIGQISTAVNGKDNPLGLSKGQIDEINQILTLIKKLISDGIQRSDVSKMIVLLAEVAEAIPEIQGEIQDIVQGLKKLSKKLFEDSNQSLNHSLNKSNTPSKGLLGMESDMLLSQEIGERGVLSEEKIIDDLALKDSELPGALLTNKIILEDTSDERLKIAEQILNIVNDQMVLSQANFAALTKGLTAIQNRAGSFETNVVDDNKISGISPTV